MPYLCKAATVGTSCMISGFKEVNSQNSSNKPPISMHHDHFVHSHYATGRLFEQSIVCGKTMLRSGIYTVDLKECTAGHIS